MYKEIACLGSGAILDIQKSIDKGYIVVAREKGIAIHDG